MGAASALERVAGFQGIFALSVRDGKFNVCATTVACLTLTGDVSDAGLPNGACLLPSGWECRISCNDQPIREVRSRPMSLISANECPEPLRQAMLDLLAYTLVTIRNEPSNSRQCQAFADHMHNVPSLLAEFSPDLLRYYWEIERPCFLRAMYAPGCRVLGAFKVFWEVVETEYQRLCSSAES